MSLFGRVRFHEAGATAGAQIAHEVHAVGQAAHIKRRAGTGGHFTGLHLAAQLVEDSEAGARRGSKGYGFGGLG
jgi:hypothetical protein